MKISKRLSPEELDIVSKGFIELLARTSEESGIPQPNQADFEYAAGARSWEAHLDILAEKGSCHEIIKKPILAKSKDSEELTKANIRYCKFSNSWKGSFVRLLPKFVFQISELPKECSYSIQVEIFRVVCRDRNFWFSDPFFRDFCENHYRCYELYGESVCEQIRVFINDFVKDLYLRLREPKTRRKILEARKAAEHNSKEYCKYATGILAARTPVIVVRIDLSYLKGILVSIKDATKDLEHFHRNMRHKPKLFKGLLGYIEKIEYGLSKGLHIHVLLFFSSERKSNADVYLAQSIGEYWVNEITGGKGHYWNGNAQKKEYEALGILGIGEIHAHDEAAIYWLCYIINYFCKVEQFIRLIADPKTKLLRRGVMPKLIGPKRGRPRNIEQNAMLSSVIEKTQAVSKGYIPHQSASSILQKINLAI